MIPPEYLPIDNRHPLHPTDPYALSKVLCEQTARAFLERGKLEVTVLRPVYVLYPGTGGRPTLLNELLTVSEVLDAIGTLP